MRVLAEQLIRQSEGLSALQLSQAVALLAGMGYDDAWGLYLITKVGRNKLNMWWFVITLLLC